MHASSPSFHFHMSASMRFAIPLAMALAISQAFAGTTTVTGTNGATGTNGVTTGGNGNVPEPGSLSLLLIGLGSLLHLGRRGKHNNKDSL